MGKKEKRSGQRRTLRIGRKLLKRTSRKLLRSITPEKEGRKGNNLQRLSEVLCHLPCLPSAIRGPKIQKHRG